MRLQSAASDGSFGVAGPKCFDRPECGKQCVKGTLVGDFQMIQMSPSGSLRIASSSEDSDQTLFKTEHSGDDISSLLIDSNGHSSKTDKIDSHPIPISGKLIQWTAKASCQLTRSLGVGPLDGTGARDATLRFSSRWRQPLVDSAPGVGFPCDGHQVSSGC